jgi:predicted CoA-binding protein
MISLKDAAEDFLSRERIVVAGVSRSSTQAANGIYRKLRSEGYTVFPVNPSAEEVEGDRCYADLASVPAPVETVIIATHPEVTPDVVRECVELGIRRVWMHRSFGDGSVSEEAVRICREHGIALIPGACPLMFCKSADLGHRCIRWWLGTRGRLPKPESAGHREV